MFLRSVSYYLCGCAVASDRSAVVSDVTNLTSIRHCPGCHPGPNASEVNCPCFVILLIVWTCAASLSKGLTSILHRFPMSSSPPTIRGTARPILSRRVDPLCTANLKGKIPIRRVNPLRGEIPVRRPQPLCTTDTKEKTLVHGADPSCTTGLKGGTPVRRLNLCCATGLQGQGGRSLAFRFDRKSGILCLEPAVSRRRSTSVNLPESGTRRGRPGYVEIGTIGTLWSSGKSWLRHDCHDSNLVVALTSEANNPVSPLFCNLTHLFSPHTDLPATNNLWWKETTLFCQLKSSWETQGRVLRTSQISDCRVASHANLSARIPLHHDAREGVHTARPGE